MRTELRQGEKLELVVRKHWITILKPIFWTVLCLLITSIIWSASTSEAGLIGLAVSAVPSIWLLYAILDRSSNIWAVTNRRVIDEFGIVSRNSKESPLDKVNNIDYHQNILGRLFGYGSVRIQTAAEMGATAYHFVANPRLLKDTIVRCQDAHKQAEITEQAQKFASAITGNLSAPAGDTKECPYCAETIKAKAKVCRFCNREL